MLTLTPPTSLLCGMSRDWIFITIGKSIFAIAASSPSRFVTSISSGKAMPASRSSALLSDSDRVGDCQMRGKIARAWPPSSAAGSNLNLARASASRIATPAWVSPDSSTTPDLASSRRAKSDGSV